MCTLYKFDVYTGKKADDGNDNDNLKEVGLGGKVVWHLVKHLCGKNHKVFFDNFFSSIPLLDILRVNKILACGTIRANRKYFPTLATDKSLKRGDFDYRTSSTGLSVYKWCDNKSVHLISNFHAVSATTVERKQKDGSKEVVACPEVAKHYNQYMGGVDEHDMLRQVYGVNRKSMKWWH